jgi:hypothetical protein
MLKQPLQLLPGGVLRLCELLGLGPEPAGTRHERRAL